MEGLVCLHAFQRPMGEGEGEYMEGLVWFVLQYRIGFECSPQNSKFYGLAHLKDSRRPNCRAVRGSGSRGLFLDRTRGGARCL